jgi:hypothetical protein
MVPTSTIRTAIIAESYSMKTADIPMGHLAGAGRSGFLKFGNEKSGGRDC